MLRFFFISPLGFACVILLCVVVSSVLSDAAPLLILAIVGVNFAGIPVVLTGRFLLKDSAVQAYIQRLEAKLPADRGIVHWERIQFTRLGVWNAPFVGHRTALWVRTAIAVELFLQNDSLKSLDGTMESRSQNLKAGKAYKDLLKGGTQIMPELEDVVKIQRVTNFLWSIGLGRLSSAIRRNRLTFERMNRLTDQDWREMGKIKI